MRQYRHLRMSPYLFLCICTLLYRWLIILFVSSRINGGRGQKRPREEETQETEVQPSSDALEFEAMAYDGFEAIREEEEGVIVPVVPLMIIEPTDDRQVVVKGSASGSTLSAPARPQPQVKIKRNKLNLKPKSIPARETRSRTVKPSANTRSRSKI